MVLRRVKDRVKERLGIAINEVGEQDVWQRAVLGVAVTSSNHAKAGELLDDVIRVASSALAAGDAELVGVARDVTTFDAPDTLGALSTAGSTPAAVDDRTGAGDKAIGAAGDDWIPDAWKDELE